MFFQEILLELSIFFFFRNGSFKIGTVTLSIVIIIAVAVLIICLNSYALFNLVRLNEKVEGIGRYVTGRHEVSFLKSIMS